ncbi:MAG: amidohydrolase family protein [Niastella sp.]|uniref:amidohydrolase family protein n=1 Tax=Niastella sp. TaxID=1869183 RepID=UPI00389AB1FE
MKKITFILSLLTGINFTHAQLPDSCTFLLHKFAQNIGKETYSVTKHGDIITYTIDFKFVDRGTPVPLKAKMLLTTEFEPVAFTINGKTSRISAINDSVVIHQNKAEIKVDNSIISQSLPAIRFPIAGYSPGTTQMLLLQYWKKHHEPATVNILPSGKVQIKKDGADTLLFNNNSLVLDRYVISGLVWGNEFLWTDANGQLFCLITNDAEGDKLEMMLEPYESLLPVLINKAAAHGMRLFTANANPSYEKHDVIAITGGTILDVENNQSISNGVVLVKNGKITKVGAANNVTVPSDAYVINAKGKTVLPGLWDMHAHFEQAEWGPAYLAAGVTTVRDCGNEFEYINAVQQAIDKGNGIGPHILKAGIIDGNGPYALGVIRANTREEAINVVQRYKENGFQQIKIYSSVKPEIIKKICAEAHRLGLLVTGHIPIGVTLQQGIDSGMDQVNHITFVNAALKKNKDGLIDFSDTGNVAVFNFLKAHHVVIDPTLGVYEMIFRSIKDSITKLEPAFASLPQPLKPLFINTGAATDSLVERGRLFMKNFKQIVYHLYTDSITIVAGTDMGFPGFSVYREMELYVESGLTPVQALQTATIVPARVMNMEKISGSISPGKNADIIITDGNPLQNISNVRKVVTVIKDGNIYNPARLHHIAGFQ